MVMEREEAPGQELASECSRSPTAVVPSLPNAATL